MWKRYFKFVKLKPGKVVTSLFGEIDFSADNIGFHCFEINDFHFRHTDPNHLRNRP